MSIVQTQIPKMSPSALSLIAAALLVWIASSVQAASFDCTKAQSKVENLICRDADISKLDDELYAAYKTALKNEKQASEVQQSQRQWIKKRNECVDAQCLAASYRSRTGALNVAIGEKIKFSDIGKESYYLVMSKDDVMCNHMRKLMNDDLERLSKGAYGRSFDRHDAFVESVYEFNSIPWKTIQASFESSGKTQYQDVESALFDLNNDGVLDFVIRYKGYLSGIRADSIYMLDSQTSSLINALSTKDLFNSSNKIDLVIASYKLSNPLEWDSARMDMISPFAYNSVSLRLLSPFIHRGATYLYMQSLYRNNEAIGGDYAVIAKYGGGIISGDDTTGKIEDICYIRRVNNLEKTSASQ